MGNISARIKEKFLYSEFRSVFGWKGEEARGRSLLFLNNLLVGIANVFVSGIFYTGFLAANGIDIVRVGVIAFIPYIAWAFGLFSPMLLSRFKRRRGLMLFNHLFYYGCVVFATTVMPMFVSDYGARTVWFAVFLFAGNVVNALFGSGVTAWHIHFIPQDQSKRNVFFSYLTLISTVISALVAVTSSLFADALSGSDQQATIIGAMRLVAFAMMVLDGLLLYLIPREYEYPKPEKKIRLQDVFTVPIHARKFILTVLIAIGYYFTASVNTNTWTFYAMNTVGIGYLLMYLGTIVCAVAGLFLLPVWRAAIARFSWFSVLLFTMLVAGLMEFAIGFSTEKTVWVFIVVSVIQGLNSVGVNLLFANIFYINLPQGNCDLYITFWNFIVNITIFFSSMLGAWFISLTEPHGAWTLFGLPFYGSQWLVWIKFVLYMLLCVYIKRVMPKVQPDDVVR